MADLEQCYRLIASTQEFRILYLQPGKPDDVLIGTLEHGTLDASTSYEALSYEWGSPEKAQEILLEKHGHRSRLGITRSLYHALRDLRQEDVSRRIWADGVYINQDDVKEREQQVSIMGSIYRGAKRVITYIGAEADESAIGIDFAYDLLRISTAKAKQKGSESSDPVPSPTEEGTYDWLSPPSEYDPQYQALKKQLLRSFAGVGSMGICYLATLDIPLRAIIRSEADDGETASNLGYEIWRSSSENPKQDEASSFALLPTEEGTYRRASLPLKSDPQVQALKKLLLRGWAARCWCAQEFLLNKELCLMCGRREIHEWALLPTIVQLVFNRELPAFLLPNPAEDPNSLRECLTVLMHTRNQIMFQHSSFTLLELLCAFHPLQTSDPRDKVYSLLGLASGRDALQLKVDYTDTVESLYITVAKSIVAKYQPIEMLYSNLGTKNLSLPSWVPDWSKWRFGNCGMLFDKWSCASGQTRETMRVEGDALDVAGCLFDQITHLSGQVGSRFTSAYSKERRNNKINEDTPEREFENKEAVGQDREDMLPTHRWLAVQLERVAQLQPYPDGSLPLDVLWRTLTTSITLEEQAAEPDHVAYYDAHLALCFEEEIGNQSDTTYSTPSSTASIRTAEREMAQEFRDNVRRRMRYRRLCVIGKRYFGAVPEEARIGDWVCMIEGARSVFVLRDVRKEKGGFQLVGPGYVHGLMRGEIMEMDGYEKGTIRLI